MTDRTEKPLSYERAIWNHVWRDFKVGFTQRFRVVVETLLLGAVTYGVYFIFGNQARVRDFSPEIVLILFGFAVAWLLLHGFWSLVTAPRAIYYEQQNELRIARANALASLDTIEWRAKHDEAHQRLEHVRHAIRECADAIPQGYAYTPSAASTWLQSATTLLKTALNDDRANQFVVPINPPSENRLDECAASLRTIAAVLKVTDLRD